MAFPWKNICRAAMLMVNARQFVSLSQRPRRTLDLLLEEPLASVSSTSRRVQVVFLAVKWVFGILLLATYFSDHEAEVLVQDAGKNFTWRYPAVPAAFGDLGRAGFKGRLVLAEPPHACAPVDSAPPKDHPPLGYPWILLVEIGSCEFGEKVLHAQQAHFDGVIIYAQSRQALSAMEGGTVSSEVYIPSVMVSADTGKLLRTKFLHSLNMRVTVSFNDFLHNYPLHVSLYPFVVIAVMALFGAFVVMGFHYSADRYRMWQCRLPRFTLKRLKTLTYHKGDARYETCAICLEDYKDRQLLRMLPCSHAFHFRCVDRWLIGYSRTCPVCKVSISSAGESKHSDWWQFAPDSS